MTATPTLPNARHSRVYSSTSRRTTQGSGHRWSVCRKTTPTTGSLCSAGRRKQPLGNAAQVAATFPPLFSRPLSPLPSKTGGKRMAAWRETPHEESKGRHAVAVAGVLRTSSNIAASGRSSLRGLLVFWPSARRRAVFDNKERKGGAKTLRHPRSGRTRHGTAAAAAGRVTTLFWDTLLSICCPGPARRTRRLAPEFIAPVP